MIFYEDGNRTINAAIEGFQAHFGGFSACLDKFDHCSLLSLLLLFINPSSISINSNIEVIDKR
jgi:hypothetical protein